MTNHQVRGSTRSVGFGAKVFIHLFLTISILYLIYLNCDLEYVQINKFSVKKLTKKNVSKTSNTINRSSSLNHYIYLCMYTIFKNVTNFNSLVKPISIVTFCIFAYISYIFMNSILVEICTYISYCF